MSELEKIKENICYALYEIECLETTIATKCDGWVVGEVLTSLEKISLFISDSFPEKDLADLSIKLGLF